MTMAEIIHHEFFSSQPPTLTDLSVSRSMFSQQQASPQFSQQSGGNIYNGNGMNLNSVSMAPNLATSSMGQMAGQMSVTSMASGPSPGLPAMGQEQVGTERGNAVVKISTTTTKKRVKD